MKKDRGLEALELSPLFGLLSAAGSGVHHDRVIYPVVGSFSVSNNTIMSLEKREYQVIEAGKYEGAIRNINADVLLTFLGFVFWHAKLPSWSNWMRR